MKFKNGLRKTKVGVVSEMVSILPTFDKKKMKETIEAKIDEIKEFSFEELNQLIDQRKIMVLGAISSETYTTLPIPRSDLETIYSERGNFYVRGTPNSDALKSPTPGNLSDRELNPIIPLI